MGRKVAFAALGVFVAILLVVLLVAKSGSENKKISLCRSEGCKVTGEAMVRFLSRDNNPCTDFYEYACGKYIFLDKPRNHSILGELQGNVLKQIKSLLSSSLVRSPVPVQLASAFYKNCLEAAPYYAVKWIEEELQDIGQWPLAAGEDEEITDESGGGEDAEPAATWVDSVVKARSDWKKNWIIGVYVVVNPKNKSKYILKVDLPEPDPFWDDLMANENSTQMEEKIAEYKETIKTTANKMGRKRDAVDTELVDSLIEFERKLASARKQAKEKKQEKFITLKELTESNSEQVIPWKTLIVDIFNASGVAIPETEQVFYDHNEYYEKLEDIFKNMNSSTKIVNAYIGWKFIQTFGGELNSLPLDEKVRTDHCLNKTFQYYSHALKRMYIEKYFESASRIRADSLIKSIKKYIIDNPNTLSLTSKDREMRTRLKKKLESVTTVIAYEDWISKREMVEAFYSDITDYADRKFLGNIVDAITGQSYKELRKLRQRFQPPISNPDVPSVLNLDAYYEQDRNRLVYAPGFLQPPIFSVDAPLPINYGAFGSWAACDLVFAFNKNGSETDDRSAKRKWWTSKAGSSYSESVRCFDELYDPIIGYNNRSLEEVIATAEGLRLSFEAFSDLVVKSRDVYCSNDKREQKVVNTLMEKYLPFLDAFKCKKSIKLKKCRL